MAWKSGSAAALRNRNEKERQEKTGMATEAGGAEPFSQRKSADSRNPLALGSTGTSWAKGSAAALRAQKQQEATSRQTGTDLYSTALEDYRTRNNLGFADAMDSRSDELNRQKVTVSPAGKMEQNASTVQKLREQRNNGIRMDVYSTVNNWKDASERNRELARLVTEPTLPRGAVSAADLPAGVDYLAADTGGMGIMPVLENTRYMDRDLKKMGYTQDEINRARLYMKAYNDLSLGERAGRRVESDLEGKKENLKGMIGQYAGALSPALTASAEEQMIRRVQSGRYTDEQLEAAGYDPELIRTAHERIRSGELYDKADDDSNRLKGLYKWGQDAHKAGENLTADAMAGESNVGRFFHGATSSAAENLIVSAINPALVLPVLSAHGAGDSMAASDEAGESPEKAILKATAKFGAGWAINSVGAADLARTMGADYARNSVAGAVADKIRALAGDSAFAAAHPAVANAISGGIDNAVQAFVETYADKAIDAALGDSEAAQTMFTTDTLVQALEAGLTGGASGALGGAVGTGLSRMNAGDSSLRGNVERYAAQDEYEQALKDYQRREELAREPEPLSQRVSADSPPNSGALGMSVESDGTEKGSADLKAAGPAAEGNSAETAANQAAEGSGIVNETQVNDDPAVHTAETAANRQAMVENAGESVESSTETAADGAEPLSQRISADSRNPLALGSAENTGLTAQNGADRQAVMQSVPVEESTLDGMDSSSPMRETYGMEAPRTEGQKQARTEQVLRSWGVSKTAAQEIGQKLPEETNVERYAAAASTLYRLGQMEDVKTFDQALELAGTGSGMAANVNYVLGNLKGRNALEIAYNYGKGEAESRWEKSRLGGTLTEQSLTGRGETIYKGTLRNANDAGSQVIELNAAATGTTAVLKNVLQNGAGQADSRVRAYVDTETARIFFGDSAQDTFGTVLHEDYHWYNALDSEGAKTLQDHALLYLARSSGFETVDEMIREKMTDYAQQDLTYEEAAEELVGDAWRGIFSTEEDFKRWVEFQRGQAEKNSGRAGTIRTVMNRVKEMLGGIISRAKEVLTLDPDNRAALKAQRLAENERRILQDEYFAHAQQAMDNLRSAKENAAALKTESAAEGQGVRYSINPSYAQDIDEWNRDGRNSREIFVLGSTAEALQGLGARENDIYMKGDKISLILEQHPEMTLNEIKRIPEILDDPILVLSSQNKGRAGSQNTRLVLFGSVKAQDGRPVLCVLDLQPVENRIVIQDMQKATSAYTKDNDPVRFVRNSEVLYTSENKKRTTALLRTLGFQMPSELQRYGSMGSISYHGQNVKMEGVPFTEIEASGGTHVESEDSRSRLPKASKQSIAQTSDESKKTNEPVKKTTRFQLAEQADREAKQNQQRQASRVLAEKAAAFDTLNQFFGLTKNTRLSDAALESLAIRWTKTNGSRADRAKLANETRALVEYLRSEGADMAKAQGLAETLAGEVLDEATYRNTELWNQYPDLHDLTYTVDKNGKAKAELVKRYGSWTEAVAEARRHGVKLRQAEGYRDGNPAEQYEAIVNDTRAVGGVKESAAALFRSAAQEAGVAGAASMESTEWLDVLMNVHDTIKPRMMSRFADVAEYEDAKVELAGRMIGDIMSHPEMTDAEAVFEGILKHNREVAAMAAGSEERAAEVTKGLKSVQQTQRKAFADRMRANSRSQSDEVKSVSRAERQLNENLETLGAQVSTAAGLDEKMTALREAYEREWKAEKKRMKLARQEMLDEIKLERQQMRSQINDLSRQVAGEQRRADRAEHQLLVQENEIMEWEAENQRKAEAWQEKQAQRNAIAIETARQQRDEDVAVAKALAEKRVQKAREGRKADELKRSIRNNAAQLRQMLLRPKPGKYVQQSLIVQAAEVAKLADMVVLNETAVKSLTRLENAISKTMGTKENPSSIAYDWEKTGVPNMIAALRTSLMDSKDEKIARLKQQLEETAALPDSDKSEQLRDRLRQRIRETENRTYLPMTVDQLRMLKAITASTLHIIRTENKTLSLARAEEVDGMAMKAAREVLNSEGNGFGEKFEKAKGAMNRYQLDMLGGTRMFRRLGGYTKNGQMEKLGQMLNDGQRRQTEILVEGESLFANVTGKEHLKEVEAFAGPGAELVDIGLKDSRGDSVPLNHAQLCSLYMLLRNEDSRHHLMTGGLTLPDAAQYAKGNIERAYQRSQTVMLGTLVNADGTPMADTILQTVQDAMTDYDRNWCKDMEDFFGRYTTNLINETSMKLLGYDRATVKNYYPIAVDRSTLATEIEGVKMDATIEGRGFLKERVKSNKPILLEECQNVVKRSLRDTAAYAGLAAPIRDVQRVLNSTVETAEGIGVLKDKIIGEKWGKETVSYINDLLTDLQTTRRKRSSTMSRALDRMRGNYAGAILTVNPGVAIAQAASLPTAGAVLGADTMAAVLPFVKNFSGKQRAAVEAEIRQHGDVLLQYRLRGTKRGEMSSIGAHKNLVAKASEAMPAVTGWITGMDEITVAALWEGSKRYVERHAAEFGEGAAEKGSEAYWEAVNKMYQRVIEETQPNYTTMQRAGIQRSDNEFVKTLTMFTTQRFQNYGILADAVGDYKAQKARYAADQSAENKAEVQRAGQSLRRAAASQVVQTAVFALMKIGADFLLHRWDKEQDENGDITAASVGKRFFDLYTESAAGNFLYGSEIYSALTNARDGKDYDVVSATNISAVNDLFAAFTKTVKLLRTDTGEMSEEELTAHHQKLNKAVLKDIQCGLELYGVPAANIRKVMQAFEGYWEDAQAIGRGEGFSFNSAPSSATGQYDRLYNAIQSGDSEEAAAAMKKLEQMNKTDKVDGELARRLKQYDADVLAAAKARNAGKARAEEKARKAVFEKLREGLDVAPVTDRAKGKTDAARRAQLIDLVNKAVDGKADELLAGSKDGSIYDALLDEVKNGRAEDAQEELDRLMTAGKDKGSIKSKITESVKEEYLAGSDRDREKLEKKLLALEDAEGKPLYEEKNFAQWVSAADKKAEKAKDEKNWWEGVK